MELVFHGRANEFGTNELEAITSVYGDKNVRLEVIEEMDTTEYLLSSPANAKHLLDAVEEMNNGTAEYVHFTAEEFEKISEELLNKK